jgi:hypothetical protein
MKTIYSHSAESDGDSDLKAFRTQKIDSTGMVSCIIELREKKNGRQLMNPISSKTINCRIQKCLRSMS